MAERARPRRQYSAAGRGLTRRILDAPLLTQDEEAMLHQRWVEHRDPAALTALITGNARIVAKLAAKFSGHGVDFEDLLQEGLIGLLETTERYDPEQGHLGSYGAWTARDRIQNALLAGMHAVRIPSKSPEANALLASKTSRLPKAMLAPALSLDAPIDEDGTALGEIVGDDRPSPEATVMEADVEVKRSQVIERALARLDEREADVIRCRFLRVPPLGRRETGQRWDVSDERARQIEIRAMQRLCVILTEEFGVTRERMLDLLGV